VECEGDDSTVADLRRMMTRMFDELEAVLKKNMQKYLSEY
jgi:hypothetical protein